MTDSSTAHDRQALALLRSMLLIRTFEAALASRPDHGFQLFSSGEEAVAVGLCAALRSDDQLLSSGRSIGPALARGLAPELVMAEVLGKAAGPCGGKGGRGHLAQPSSGFVGAHAVVAGNISISAGVALAAQLMQSGTVVACVFGDGACGAGALHETLNIAALWKLPLIFVCDNNQWSISTARRDALAPTRLADLARPFGIPATTVDGMDVFDVRAAVSAGVDRARRGEGPTFVECLAERFMTHSTATRETRSAHDLAAAWSRCPIRRLTVQLQADGVLTGQDRIRLEREVDAVVAAALRFADSVPYPDESALLSDVD